jgi:hypothetical protein
MAQVIARNTRPLFRGARQGLKASLAPTANRDQPGRQDQPVRPDHLGPQDRRGWPDPPGRLDHRGPQDRRGWPDRSASISGK